MNPKLVIEAAYIIGVKPERVFGLAEEWTETFIPRKKVVNDFQEWYFKGIVPPYVEDYVIDILAGRVNPL
jgi:hypothetical protein